MLKVKIEKIINLVLISTIYSLLNLGIIYIINCVLLKESNTSMPAYTIFVFLIFIIYSYILNILFQSDAIKYSISMVYNNEIEILKTLHNTSLRSLERIGSEKFYNVLEDLRFFSFFPNIIITTINSILVVFFCFTYLMYSSLYVGMAMIFSIGMMSVFYMYMNRRLSKKYSTLRRYNDDYYKYINDSILGFKQFKISAIRVDNLFSRYIVENRSEAKELDVSLSIKFVALNLIGQYGLYFIICILLGISLFTPHLSSTEVISFIIFILFISAPLTSIISMQNFYTKGFVSYKRIKSFYSLLQKEQDSDTDNESMINNQIKEFETLEFQNLNYSYENNLNVIQDLSLKITQGEILFLIGGNGSGKSTFINILTGLYKPENGVILINNQEIDNSCNSYKSLFSVIYSDQHIFSNNYDDYDINNNPGYTNLIQLMKLDHVLNNKTGKRIEDKFSKGQVKRIALILALLENHPIIVLDEWAADQDPYFRKYFYQEILPTLKENGKTIIAVTHDDKYFNLADRIFKFEYGKINQVK